MKTLKILFVSVFFLSIFSCSDDDERAIALELTRENLAGTYNISSLSAEENESTVRGNTTVNISTTTIVGDTFQFDFVLNANGTFTAVGQYRITSTTSANGGQPQTETEIINIDTSGTYSINTTSGVRSISFSPVDDDFLEGTFAVNLFNSTNLALIQETEETDGQIDIDREILIGFTRK